MGAVGAVGAEGAEGAVGAGTMDPFVSTEPCGEEDCGEVMPIGRVDRPKGATRTHHDVGGR